MTTVENPHAHAWADIAARAETACQWACVLAARQSIPSGDPAALTAAYHRIRGSGVYVELDSLPLSAGYTADLALVVHGGADGVNASRLDGSARTTLARRGFTAVRPGSRWPADDWRATVIATLTGLAVVRAAQCRPVALSEMEAVPLAVIEREMRTKPEGGSTAWPGSDLALRMAQMWRLVEYVRLPAPPSEHWSGATGKAVYRLTPEGVAALERARRARGDQAATVTKTTADVLALLSSNGKGDLGELDPTMRTAVQKCLNARWVTEGALIPGTQRRALKMTEAGRDALAGYRFRLETATSTPRYPTRQVNELQRGQVVRMGNRRDHRRLSPDWVTVVEVKHHASTDRHLANNYEVWVTSEAVPGAYLYAGQPLYRTVRFQIKPL